MPIGHVPAQYHDILASPALGHIATVNASWTAQN